jgi:hypothetical protein
LPHSSSVRRRLFGSGTIGSYSLSPNKVMMISINKRKRSNHIVAITILTPFPPYSYKEVPVDSTYHRSHKALVLLHTLLFLLWG